MVYPCVSKSKYLAGLQCPKLLWYHFNEKSAIPEVDSSTQALFDSGREVEEYAHSLYPSGCCRGDRSTGL
jgi:hypothetical protein